MQKIVITGITGKSGQYMYKHLLENIAKTKHMKIIFTIRKTSNKAKFVNIANNMNVQEGDLEDEIYLNNLCNGIRYIVSYCRDTSFFKAC